MVVYLCSGEAYHISYDTLIVDSDIGSFEYFELLNSCWGDGVSSDSKTAVLFKWGSSDIDTILDTKDILPDAIGVAQIEDLYKGQIITPCDIEYGEFRIIEKLIVDEVSADSVVMSVQSTLSNKGFGSLRNKFKITINVKTHSMGIAPLGIDDVF